MRALAGPAMLLVIVGGFGLHRVLSSPDSPPRSFLDREFAAPVTDDDDTDAPTGTCFSLSTVIIANTMFDTAQVDWKPAGDDRWLLALEDIVPDTRGPVHVYQRFTFERRGDLVHLVSVEASERKDTDVTRNIDELLKAPNGRSTPIERCLQPGATGYRFRPRR